MRWDQANKMVWSLTRLFLDRANKAGLNNTSTGQILGCSPGQVNRAREKVAEYNTENPPPVNPAAVLTMFAAVKKINQGLEDGSLPAKGARGANQHQALQYITQE